jgi:hypothetical protein
MDIVNYVLDRKENSFYYHLSIYRYFEMKLNIQLAVTSVTSLLTVMYINNFTVNILFTRNTIHIFVKC